MSHIVKLGATAATLREYTTEKTGDGIAWERGPASPFAARVNSSGKYDEIDIWNEWVQEDWQAGVGRVDPEAGGYLFSTLETRVPSQVILSPQVQQCDARDLDGTTADCRYIPDNIAGTVSGGNSLRVACPFTTPAAFVDGSIAYYFYARLNSNVDINIEVWSNSSGSPGTSLDSGSTTSRNDDYDFRWWGVTIPTTSLSNSTLYWLVFDVTGVDAVGGTAEIAYGTSGYDTASKSWNGSSWVTLTGQYLVYTTGHHSLDTLTSDQGAGTFRFNGALYSYKGERLYKLDVANNQMDVVNSITGTGDITSHAIFGPTVYFGRATGNYTTMDTAESFAAAGTTRKLFLEAEYLYGTWQNDLYYSSDGSTWSSAFQIGSDAHEIRGMAGMGDSLYLATDKALWRFAPGDQVEWVSDFGSVDSNNGVGMIEYQGRLYIPAGGRLFRFDPSGQMMDIWVNRDDDLPTTKVGKIVALARMNNWLVAYTLADGDYNVSRGFPSLWAWQEEGWHLLANVYQRNEDFTQTYQSIYYDRGTSRLWWSTDMGSLQYTEIDDYTINPFNLSSYVYMPFGWLQQDRFYGGQYLLDKSWESVTIVGDNLSTDVHVKVYWQDEGSVVDSVGVTHWELLGTADSDGEELRWTDYDTRPSGRWIKLAFRLQTNDGDKTPRVRAVVVKFLPMVNDRIRDNVTLTLHSNVEMPDGTPDAYTLAQQLTHIQSLIESVDPIIYEDPFHDQYEVTLVDWRMSALLYDSDTGVLELRVTLVLEQLPDEQYA